MQPSQTITRRTIAGEAEVRGVTLFARAQSGVRIRPAKPGAGIAFARPDVGGHEPVPARAELVVPESRRTVLARPGTGGTSGGITIQTIEHVMSALAGLGVTDALVEVDGPEVPIGDGSALPFVEALLAAGIRELRGEQVLPIVIRERIEMEPQQAEGSASREPARMIAEPAEHDGLELVYHLDYGPGSPLPPQTAKFVSQPGNDAYASEIAPARTFSTLAEVTALRKMGLFGHLTAKDMLVIGPEGPIDNEYRFPDEPARHKVLDMLGDLALAGRPIRGRVTAWKTGHAMNHEMARRLAAM